MKKRVISVCIFVLVGIITVLFIIFQWWIVLLSELSILLVMYIVVSYLMVGLVLKRKTPVSMGEEIGEDEGGALKESVRDAVLWLESGELWEQTSEDGLHLCGRFVKNGDSHTYAVCCHGYNNHRMQDISNQARRFYELGHNVFAGHARGHGRSEGTYIGMACKERRDIVGWIRRIIDMDPEARIFLYGVSMGGATVMTTCGEPDLPENVRVAIEDCGYSSIWEEYAYQLRYEFGIPVCILYLCEAIAGRRYGFGFRKYSAKEQVKKIRVPILFIHGDLDTFVPYRMMEPLYEACGSEYKRRVTIEGARHAEAYKVNPDLYWKEVDAWLYEFL